MKKNSFMGFVLIVNAVAIFWLIYLATFNIAVKYTASINGSPGEDTIIPYQHLIFPILALLLSSFFFIRSMFGRNSDYPAGKN